MQKSPPGQLTALLLPLLLLLSVTSFAGEKDAATGLSATIQKARSAGAAFIPVDLFTPANGNKHTGLLREETLLTPVYQHVSTLFKTKPQAITLSLKTAAGKQYTLELLTAHPLSDAPNMGVIDADGRHQVPYNDGLHYQGVVAGEERSMASMSVFANGDMMMLFATKDGNFNVGKLEDQSGNYILYNDQDMLQKISMPCGTAEKDYSDNLKKQTASKGTSPKLCNKVQLYWEGDYDLYRRKGNSLATARNYMTGLFNQMQTLYANEYIAVELKSLYIWSVSDDYPKTSSGPALTKFRSFWNNLGDSYDGHLAHLITMDSNGNGGLGYVDVLCNKGVGYSYSEINGTFQTVPTYSWDAMVVTHETGHNLGSSHTHWCGWNTGTGGACGAIDNCYTLEGGSGCSTCPATYSTATSGWRGTIMSYCHLSSVGINLANGFGPLPGDLIRTNVSGSGCLPSIISARLTPVSRCNGNDGAINLTYNANNFAVPPMKYYWVTNDTTQNLNGLGEGNYIVAITDSNNCYLELSTDVITEKKAGNGITPTVHMPICCQSTTQTLTLRATAPTYIDFDCHTIAWLKTAAPVTSYAGLAAAYSTAAAGDVRYSTNEAGINQAIGAALTVQPPVTCAAPVTDYYTPFVTRKRRNTLHITTASTSSLFYSLGGVQVGGYTVILDQSAQVTGCYLTDTPTTRSLTVTVSGYTGRANKMTLAVMNASNQVLYSQVGLAGDGVYSIPMSIFSSAGAALQQLRFRAFDFNCTTVSGGGLNCVTSACTINVERTLHYDSITHAVPLTSCITGSSIRVDFAPTGCAPMATPEMAKTTVPSLFPNPARQSVVLKFTTAQAGNAVVKITDVTGKEVFSKSIRYNTGAHTEEFNVNEWARGVYFVSLSGAGVSSENLKLVLE